MNAAALREGVLALSNRYEKEPEHPRHVAQLALALFDDLEPWHRLEAADRLLLEAGALLHDIGWAETLPDGRGHHKVGARLILAHDWPGVARTDVALIAQIARYHRKAPPSSEHVDYFALASGDKTRVRVMAGILRVADGLDRKHLQIVERVRAGLSPRLITVCLFPQRDPGAEIAAAEKKANLLRAEFGGELCWRVEGPDGAGA